jgi:hypothetical protein
MEIGGKINPFKMKHSFKVIQTSGRTIKLWSHILITHMRIEKYYILRCDAISLVEVHQHSGETQLTAWFLLITCTAYL